MTVTWHASLLLVIGALAIASPPQGVRAEASEETYGDWRVLCDSGACNAYQVGIGGAAPVILRVLRGEPPAPEIRIEGGPFDAKGLVNLILDGRERGGGPAAPGSHRNGRDHHPRAGRHQPGSEPADAEGGQPDDRGARQPGRGEHRIRPGRLQRRARTGATIGALSVVVAHSTPREFLRLIRAGHAGFFHRHYGCV